MSCIDAAIIGAGPAGIAALRVFTRRNLDVRCFETGDRAASRWSSDVSDVTSPVYDSLRLNNSRARMRLSGTSIPTRSKPFPTATEFHGYLTDVLTREGLNGSIDLNHSLIEARRVGNEWKLSFANGAQSRCRHLVLATGMNSAPAANTALMNFEGPIIRAREYRGPGRLRGLRVLVVGGGNSGAEIACELAGPAAAVDLAIGAPAHVVPRQLMTVSADRLDGPFLSRFPLPVRQAMHDVVLFPSMRRARRAGLPLPEGRLLSSAWTISSDLVRGVREGAITIRARAKATRGKTVRFVDGSEASYDVLIWAGGYEPRFDPLPVEPPVTRLANLCYLKIVPPDTAHLPGVFLLAFCLPLGALLPVAEAQARWTAAVIEGSVTLPPRQALESIVARDVETDKRRFPGSASPTMLVDPYPYIRRLERQVRRHGDAREKRLRRRR
jgi:hypothetical protein